MKQRKKYFILRLLTILGILIFGRVAHYFLLVNGYAYPWIIAGVAMLVVAVLVDGLIRRKLVLKGQ